MYHTKYKMHCFPVFLLCLLAVQTIGAYSCLQTEKDALLEFKAGVNDSFHLLTSWRGEDCCTWAGIKCSNQTGHVVKLNLRNPSYYLSYNNSLSGGIGASLHALTDLKHLDLSNNNFSGSIFPKFICSLRYLKYLNLSHIGLSGMIPSQLSNLSRLQYLDLSYNGLSGIIPPQLSNLSRLQYLDLSFNSYPRFYYTLYTNSLTIANIWWLSHLTSLTYLDLCTINLQDSKEWLHALNMLPSLETLYLGWNNLTTIPSSLSAINFTSLTSFLLNGNNFNCRIPAWIGKLTSLRILELSHNLFFGPIPNLFGNLGSLNLLFISDSLEGPAPSLNNLHNLTRLGLDGININQDIKELLSKFSNEALRKLEELELANTNLTGNLSGCLDKMPNLTGLLLGGNKLNGTIPVEIWKRSNFSFLSLSRNSFTGEISELHLNGLSKLEYLDLSSNFINITIDSHWIPPFQLFELYLSACNLGPAFPSWLHNQFELFELNLSNSRISDIVPTWFWNLSSLYIIDLSHNQIRGRLPLSLENLIQLDTIQLSNNQFHGAMPALPTSFLETLDFSYNSISGPLPQEFEASFLVILILSNNLLNGTIGQSICGLISLGVLDLSSNNIHGDLPHCWPNTLQVVNLANNKFNGIIPSTLSSLNMLSALQLNGNSLTGEIPSSMQFCKNMSMLDLGENKIYGKIPEWLGKMSMLIVLRLRSNLFIGDIPMQLANLTNLQVLDLGDNNLSGLIPDYLDNMAAMTLPNLDRKNKSILSNLLNSVGFSYYVSILVSMKGLELEYSSTLALLTSIDLSRNNLTGEIPQSITTLIGLRNLNLSCNYLNGTIPTKMGSMQSLESLDLHRNGFSGIIPQSLANLNFLDTLNLSYNNLSGRIPTGDQLQTILDPYVYIGNAYLCGNKSCNSSETSHNDIVKNNDNDLDEVLSYLIMVIGFGFGFWTFFGVLMFKRNWRYCFFQIVDNMFDRLYVFVIYFARLRRDA